MLTATIAFHIACVLVPHGAGARNVRSMLSPLLADPRKEHRCAPFAQPSQRAAAAARRRGARGLLARSRQQAADARLRAIYAAEWSWRTRAAARREDGTRADRRPPAEGGSRDAGDAPASTGKRRSAKVDAHRAREPLGRGAGELRHLPRAAAGADRRPALPRLRDAGQFRLHLLDRHRLHRAPARSARLDRLPALDRADAGHSALLRRADGRDARGTQARLHAAARDHARGAMPPSPR